MGKDQGLQPVNEEGQSVVSSVHSKFLVMDAT